MDDDFKKAWGMFAGGLGGLIAGGKIGLGASAAIALIPVIGPFLAAPVLVASPVIGLVCGSKFGKSHPGVASVSAAIGIAGLPGLPGHDLPGLGTDGVAEALTGGAGEALPS